jgi:stearoyl-CoA desaturase (Delta-9 desaturase)
VIRSSRNYRFAIVVPVALAHLGALTVFFIPFRWSGLWLALAMYVVRMFGITAGYHRYFSHRSYRLGRAWQFLMAFLAETSGQRGVLWWAAHHRLHHHAADRDGDIHSPHVDGFWWSHVGWVLSNQYYDYDLGLVRDFAKYPELRWLDKHFSVPPVFLGGLVLIIGGWHAFIWGFLVSTVVLFHATCTINSLAHVWGSRRFATPDDSRNNLVLALVTMGEGWHNNHHRFMYACRQGIRWWEVDLTFYALKSLSWCGIARDLREVGQMSEARPA